MIFIEIIKFMSRFAYQLGSFLLISLPLTLIGIVILYPFMKNAVIGHFPAYLRWFDSADTYVGRDVTTITLKNNESQWNKYWWVAIRNPINYFTYKYLSFDWKDVTILRLGNFNVGDSRNKVPGICYTEVFSDGDVYYEYYVIVKFNENWCFRFRMGYKIGDPETNALGTIQQQVLVLQPVKSYTGQ